MCLLLYTASRGSLSNFRVAEPQKMMISICNHDMCSEDSHVYSLPRSYSPGHSKHTTSTYMTSVWAKKYMHKQRYLYGQLRNELILPRIRVTVPHLRSFFLMKQAHSPLSTLSQETAVSVSLSSVFKPIF